MLNQGFIIKFRRWLDIIRLTNLTDRVDDAMHMFLDSLVVGQVRDGMAAMSLFSASRNGDGSGCAGVKLHESNQIFFNEVDLIVQIGILHEVRWVIATPNVTKDLKTGMCSLT